MYSILWGHRVCKPVDLVWQNSSRTHWRNHRCLSLSLLSLGIKNTKSKAVSGYHYYLPCYNLQKMNTYIYPSHYEEMTRIQSYFVLVQESYHIALLSAGMGCFLRRPWHKYPITTPADELHIVNTSFLYVFRDILLVNLLIWCSRTFSVLPLHRYWEAISRNSMAAQAVHSKYIEHLENT